MMSAAAAAGRLLHCRRIAGNSSTVAVICGVRRQVTRQIHGVLKDVQNLDQLLVRRTHDAEHREVTPLAAGAGDVQRAEPPGRCHLAVSPE